MNYNNNNYNNNYNNSNQNQNQNQNYQRVLTQACFKCQGEGKLYPFEGKKGIPSNCNVCNGGAVIDGSYSRCHWCKGEAIVFPFSNRGGIPKDCYICNGNGYLAEPLELCRICQGEGKVYPFSGRSGIPSTCNPCFGKGGSPMIKKYVVTDPNFNPYGNNYNQNQQNYNNYVPQTQSMITTSFEPIQTNYNQNQNYNNYVPQTQSMITTSFEPISNNYNQNQQNYNNYVPQTQSMITTSFEPIQTNYNQNYNKIATIHPHNLVSSNLNGAFSCNVCDRAYTNAISNRCGTCDFDVCVKRINTNSEHTNLHFHPLIPTQRNNNWICNECKSSHRSGIISWYCRGCDFDTYCSCYY